MFKEHKVRQVLGAFASEGLHSLFFVCIMRAVVSEIFCIKGAGNHGGALANACIRQRESVRFCIKVHLEEREVTGAMQSEACVSLIDKLEREGILTKEEFVTLMERHTDQDARYLFQKADALRKRCFGKHVYIQQLIEYTNYCKSDCYYCVMCKKNENLFRFRMHYEEIMKCCEEGYRLGFRTFVLRGGEDSYYTDARLVYLVSSIHQRFPDCVISLSIGEKPRESYESYFRAGANGYLLRHPDEDAEYYGRVRPPKISLKNRMNCLYDLKELGYQVGMDFAVGLPGQRPEHLAEEILFVKKLAPYMVDVVPYIPDSGGQFWKWQQDSLEFTLFMTGILRLVLPQALLSSSWELDALQKEGQIRGILAGANVIVTNLLSIARKDDPVNMDACRSIGAEAGKFMDALEKQVKARGYEIVMPKR